MPEHVTLVITDTSQDNYYVVNNDQVSPARHGDVMEDVARAYAPIAGQRDLVTPAMEIGLGSTASTDRQFRTQAWSRYRDSASWGVHVPPPQPGTTTTPAEQVEAAYLTFYATRRFYDEGSTRLHERVDALVQALSRADPADRMARLSAEMPALSRLALDVGLAFEQAGPHALVDTTRPDSALAARLRRASRYLLLSSRADVAPALARAAMALLHLEHQGGTLSPVEREIITVCDHDATMHAALQAYRRAGFPPSF
jgi:hypothetical protein